jgi:cell division protein FtsQ
MTTLQMRPAALRAAVASYPVVRELKIAASFPHGLSIRVVEQPPVAALAVAGTKTAVAATGVVLGPRLASGSLPALAGVSLPAPGQRLHNAKLLGAVAVLGAAPSPLVKQVTRAYSSSKGLTLAMHSGLLVYFGDATRSHAKWLSLARLLADASSAGASYVDVRLPERPAAGFPGGVAPSISATEAEASSSGSTGGESTEALAERLSAAVGGGSTVSSPSSSSSTSGEAEKEAQTEPETQTPTTSSGETSGVAAAESGG